MINLIASGFKIVIGFEAGAVYLADVLSSFGRGVVLFRRYMTLCYEVVKESYAYTHIHAHTH